MENENQIPVSPATKNVLAKLGLELWDIAKLLLIALVIVLPLRYYIAQPFIVRGASMEPNFQDRQYLVIDELTYHLRMPKREESIVFHYHKDPQEYFIKRIIGLPGETVVIKDGDVTIKNSVNPEGFKLEQPYLSPPDHPTYPDTKMTLGADEYFVLGDNRDFSSDSRIWGAVNKNLIVGRTIFRAWPFSKFGPIPDYSIGY